MVTPERNDYHVIIAGGGPAGASAAIHLANRGVRVLLAEQKKFPRAKLCGEFISPECASHFERLGIADRMLTAGPARLVKTVFYSRTGKSVSIPSAWFGADGIALGLSRAEMDERLLRRAVDAGATVVEEAQVAELLFDATRVCGVKLRTPETEERYRAPITIDATGRSRALARLVGRQRNCQLHHRAPRVAFKAHLDGARAAPGACEIYFYRGGYGGLSSVENGRSNLCFIASTRDVRRCSADAERVMREIVCQNLRAAETLAHARARTPWLAVTLESFGRHQLVPAPGLLAIGDAASFIDPFTGSGMLMALENGELAAQAIADYLSGPDQEFTELETEYRRAYRLRFNRRLRVCSLLRRAAFVPGLAKLAIRFCGASDRVRRRITLSTRQAPSVSI